MSNYRDDMNDTAIASDSTWGGLRSIVESTARIRDVVISGLTVMLVDGAIASDSIIDKVRPLLTEQAVVSDQVLGAARLRTLVVERARARDVLLTSTRAMLEDGATVRDELLPVRVRAVVTERASVQDVQQGQRHVRQLVTEQVRASDQWLALRRQLVQDSLQARDTVVLNRLRAKSLVQEQASAADQVLDAVQSAALVLVERARATDEAFGLLRARDQVQDAPAVAWDEALQPGQDAGQAWTADAANWAMSRYAPFTFEGLAVIDGTVYATSPEGVFALDGQDEDMAAVVRTGRLDMSSGVQVHPRQANFEYELRGQAWVDVLPAQGGTAPQPFSYPFDTQPADSLTSGRVQFGMGLRARHFTYTLRLNGTHAYINDWSVLLAPSKRSL